MENDVIELVEVSYSLSGGDFFTKNPDKILAEPYEASGRFGPVTKYRPKGDATALDMLEQIETPPFIAEGVVDASAGKSVISADPDDIPTNQEENNIEKSIKESEKEIVSAETRKKKQKYASWDEPEVEDIQSFQEVLKKYNPDLNEEEIKVFLWYMNDIGSPWTGQWLNIYNPSIVTSEAETVYIRNWMTQGFLFYFSGQFIPKVLYLSGNLYEKKIRFDAEKQTIIDAYGQSVTDIQEKALNEAFNEVYESRLKLDNPDESQRLRIRPFSEFAKTTMVKNWNMDPQSGDPAAFVVPVSHSEKSFGQINWYSKKTSVSRWDANAESREEIPLSDAFRYWLKHDDNRPSLPYQFTWEDIFKFYLDKKAVKNIDKTYLARMRALTKESGDNFFSKFMAEIISENDRVKIEQSWNEKFNGSRAIDYDKIPIAFASAKNYPGNELLDVRPEKREAVGFHSINGSSLIAYGVGYGKANLLTSNILTPTGWVKMGGIKPGMHVIGKNGHPTKVLQIFPQGKMEAYRVTFSDGSSTEVTGDHLWEVQSIYDRDGETPAGKRVHQTKDLIGKLRNYRGNREETGGQQTPLRAPDDETTCGGD